MDLKRIGGWPTGLAPFGYINTNDRDAPIQPHPERAPTVKRIFELYSGGGHTFKSLGDHLYEEGHTFRQSQKRFHRSALACLLNNRFYIGEHRSSVAINGRSQFPATIQLSYDSLLTFVNRSVCDICCCMRWLLVFGVGGILNIDPFVQPTPR